MQRILVVVGLFVFAACGREAPLPLLRIATDATFAPFHFLDEAGRPTGFDVELARAVALQAGFEPDVLVLSYDELFAGLENETHDVVAATTGITPERQRIYSFTEPYFETCQVAVVRVGASEPETLADLRGARIGAAGAGTAMKAMESIAGDRIRIADGAGVRSLHERSIDAWIVDEFDGVSAVRESNGRLRVLPAAVALEKYAFVLAIGRGDLKAQLDDGLAQLQRSGHVAKLQTEFGVERGLNWPVVCAG
jgi:ABC-type amino acid transport substrate-binding protein